VANSPSHKFGQDLGNLLEHVVLYRILKPRLQDFTSQNKYFLDWQTDRPARPGRKVTWQDQFGNSHDLDFVIEAGGTPEKIGTPVTFIEAAWRRYTKHSKNKVQEIQGAILPIVELHKLSAPFYGAVLAGDFSKPALEQLRNNRFSVLYIPYKSVVAAFKAVKFDIAFDEQTSDEVFAEASSKLTILSDKHIDKIRSELVKLSATEIDNFMSTLEKTLMRLVTQIVLIPMYGAEFRFTTLGSAVKNLATMNFKLPVGQFQKIEVIVDYSNGDSIRASFASQSDAVNFLGNLR